MMISAVIEESETIPILPDGWGNEDSRPLEIDVGCHKGLFLFEMAQRYPDRNFLGIERQAKRVSRTQGKIVRNDLPNAAVVHLEAFEGLSKLPEGSVSCLYVSFPDPWPKRRHASRRLVQDRFLLACAHCLKVEGLLRIATDDPPYALWIAEKLDNASSFFATVEEATLPPLPATEFEKKFVAQDKPIHRFARRLMVRPSAK
jgi:tRNA (guanine-N7-)-methyltransferase